MFSELVAHAKTASESLQDQWDVPATIQMVRLADPAQVESMAESLELTLTERGEVEMSERFGFGVEISPPIEIDGQPFESLIGITAPQDIIGLLVTCEAWGPPLEGLRPQVTPTLAADGRIELRITLLMLRDGLEDCQIWVRGAGWLSDILIERDPDAPHAVGGRIAAALRLTFGRPSDLARDYHQVEGPAEALAALAHEALLRPAFFLGSQGHERAAGEYLATLRHMVEEDTGETNLISGVAAIYLNDPWVDALAGAASWAEVKDRVLTVLADSDPDSGADSDPDSGADSDPDSGDVSDPTGMRGALSRELRFDVAAPVDEVVRWADGDMFHELFSRELSSTRVANNNELQHALNDLEQAGVPEAFLEDFVNFFDRLGVRLHQDAQALVSDF